MDSLGVGKGPERVSGTIDLDATPFVPDGWEVRREDQIPTVMTGTLEWEPAKIGLHLDRGQLDGGRMAGTELLARLIDHPVLPAHVLDWLLAHPERIPEAWRKKAVFFWTVYRRAGGFRCVRFLYSYGGVWSWDYCWIDLWDEDDPAAVHAG